MVQNILQRIVADLALYCDSGRIDSYQVRLEWIYRELLCIEVMGNLSYDAGLGLDYVRTALALVQASELIILGQRKVKFSAAYFCTIAIHS